MGSQQYRVILTGSVSSWRETVALERVVFLPVPPARTMEIADGGFWCQIERVLVNPRTKEVTCPVLSDRGLEKDDREAIARREQPSQPADLEARVQEYLNVGWERRPKDA